MNIIRAAIIGLMVFPMVSMTGCVLIPGDLYIVGEGGYQDVKISQDEGTFERNDYTYGAALGYGLSLSRLYVGGEFGVAVSSFKDDLAVPAQTVPEGDDATTPMEMEMPMEMERSARIEENYILHAVVDGGVYVFEDLLVFGRAGYIYVDSDIDSANVDGLDDEFSVFAFGGGVEYEIGLGLGVRVTYLRHEDDDRDADDVRVGIIWRF